MMPVTMISVWTVKYNADIIKSLNIITDAQPNAISNKYPKPWLLVNLKYNDTENIPNPNIKIINVAIVQQNY